MKACGHPGHRGDVPGLDGVGLHPVQALKAVKHGEVGLAVQFSLLQEGHLLAPAERRRSRVFPTAMSPT